MCRASSEGLGLFLLRYVRESRRVQCISAERNVLSDKLAEYLEYVQRYSILRSLQLYILRVKQLAGFRPMAT